ncbi:MAG: SPASM domain-containing protein [Campylobacterota bacterium]|nr:SPASM domain-containing protein [Campylobacterota bacterium]
MPEYKKAIHLLYVPTLFCNMGCQYCYLGDETEAKIDTSKAVETLKYAIANFTQKGYIPYNLSFHGGEVSTLPSSILEELFKFTKKYYQEYNHAIESFGYKHNPIHIKTNLYNFDKHYDVCSKYGVSISGSVDLPLSLHEKYRVDKQGNSTLEKIKSNLALLATYPHHKKISCVVTQEHLDYIDAFIADIKTIHYDIGLDMSRFNIMFGFDSLLNEAKFESKIEGTQMLSDTQQVILYKALEEAFVGTELEQGFREHWFREFTPEYCCSASNCGNKFFLVQFDGEVYSCPRGQSSSHYRYGNIFQDSIEEIIQNGYHQIALNENKLGIDAQCLECQYFGYCNLGCTFVRSENQTSKSYTCALQKEIYRDNPSKYPPYSPDEVEQQVSLYCYQNKIQQLPRLQSHPKRTVTVTNELYEEQNAIATIIQNDTILHEIYSDRLFFIELDSKRYPLVSPILKTKQEILFWSKESSLMLYIDPKAMEINCDAKNIVNNTLHIMLLRNTTVVYGDEGREKQEHLFDYSIYWGALQSSAKMQEGFLVFDLGVILRQHSHLFIEDIRNNLFVTTKTMREYHYAKQKKNAFYHLQAINLPFVNMEFYTV